MQPSRALPRRRFVGYLLVAPTLVAAARLGVDLLSAPSAAAQDGPPVFLQPAATYDLTDLLTDAARPTAHLISVRVEPDGTASFALPRAEVGQGITTAAAMLIAEELDLPLAKVHVTLADARPELMWNQLTGGSNTLHAMYEPIRLAAATAREQLKRTAAARWGVPAATLTTRDGMVHGSGRSASYGSLAAAAAVVETTAIDVELKPATKFSLVGKPQNRVDAHLAVTGRKVFTMDVVVPGAQPAMVCRPPTITGRPRAIRNLDVVAAMPGISHVVTIPTGVAVVGSAFGLCIDAINALDVDWEPGPMAGKSTSDVVELLEQAELPLTPPPPGAKTVPEVVDRPRVLHLPTTDEQEDAMTDVGDVRRLVQQAIDAGATTVGEIHQRIAAMPLEALETFDSTGTARKVQQLAECSIGNVYETIRDVNQHVGEMAEELLTGAKAGKS